MSMLRTTPDYLKTKGFNMATRESYDPALFEGTASYYSKFRRAYPLTLVRRTATKSGLGSGSAVLDLGCGTGLLALELAPMVSRVIAMDPDAEMLTVARLNGVKRHISNIQWIEGSSFSLDASIGQIDAAFMGESFHWMDRYDVIARLNLLIDPDGGVAVFSKKLVPPSDCATAISMATEQYLGAQRRAGGGTYQHPLERHAQVLAKTVFSDIEVLTEKYEEAWTSDDVLGYLYSTSYSARRLFGDKVAAFEAELLTALKEASHGTDQFTYTVESTAIVARRN
jgi:ubiquinone/menaquinone biosynthesis C-methylase UbiE